MTLPQNVEDAVALIETLANDEGDYAEPRAVETIRAHLLSQEAEIELLRVGCERNLLHAQMAESRLATANALLRELLGAKWCTHEYVDVCNRSATHLRGAGDEA